MSTRRLETDPEPPTMRWDGITDARVLHAEDVAARHELADAAREFKWSEVASILTRRPELANTTRLGGTSRYAPLHQAAHGGASAETVEEIIQLGAWRTLQNVRGERPIDVAIRQRHTHLIDVLRPRLVHDVPTGILLRIQSLFHEVIHGRIAHLDGADRLRLPELEPILEFSHSAMWFAVPGMYGGFNFRLECDGVNTTLVADSWCRVAGGSGQTHAITSAGHELVASGWD